ncbi:monothiol glutaredoxin-5 [Amanita rubescens]|nr:monothiol glutaredoxin-5 [Amanita rubescens]
MQSLFLRSATRTTFSARCRLGSLRFITQEARTKIDGAVKAKPLVLFMKGTPELPQCGFSRAVVQILDLHGVAPEKMQSYDVLADPELRSSIKEYSEWPTVPQVYVNGEFIGGCDIVLGMHQSGELEAVLEKHGVIPKVAEEDLKPASASS